MSRVKELERRLRDEPDNLGLRVTLAGALREAGREADALELYRSVAIAYRDQGRHQQAISVCRSILELAPGDAGCRALLASLAPARRSSMEETPLPGALPYHVADPTTHSVQKVSAADLDDLGTTGTITRISDPELPAAEGVDTRPGSEPRPSVVGIANAARRISASFIGDDLAAEIETRVRHVVPDDATHDVLSRPPPTVPFDLPGPDDEPDDEPTAVPPSLDTDDELTDPRDLPRRR